MAGITVSQAAHELGTSVDTVRRRLKSGELSGQRDERGQWWINIGLAGADDEGRNQDNRLSLGVGTGLKDPDGEGQLISTLYAQIDDLRTRLDRSEEERRQDKAQAQAERERLVKMIGDLVERAKGA